MAPEATVSLSRPAREDLDGIWDYIARDSPGAADRFVHRIVTRCQSYAHQPQLGESRDDLLTGCRMFSVGSYVVYYRASSNGIQLLRILHGARHVDRLS